MFMGTKYFGGARSQACKEDAQYDVGYLAEDEGYLPIAASDAVFAHEVVHTFKVPHDDHEKLNRPDCNAVGTNLMSPGCSRRTPRCGDGVVGL